MSARWLAASHDDGVLSARIGRDGDRLIAEWPGRARMSAASDGSDVSFVPEPHADATEIDKIRRGAVRLLLAHLAGAIPLHGSAVAIDGRAIVFVGGTGLGKSTLAAALCDFGGASLLSDDAVVVEKRGDAYDVASVEELHWLDAASARALGRGGDFGDDKAPLRPHRTRVSDARLSLVVHLEFAPRSDPKLTDVVGLAAVSGLLTQLTRFVVDDPAIARRDLSLLADLVEHTRIGRLERPRRLDLLGETARAITSALDEIKP